MSAQRSFSLAGAELLNPIDANPRSSKTLEKVIPSVIPFETFTCAINSESGVPCSTGQRRREEARKAVSDHFGRNKRETRMIPRWVLICRKHYQRGSYHSAEWQLCKLELIARQLELIEEDVPGCRYLIGLKASEKSRLDEYLSPEDSSPGPSISEKIPPKEGETPCWVLCQLSQTHMQGDTPKSIQECKEVLREIYYLLKYGKINHVPSIEFIPQFSYRERPRGRHKGFVSVPMRRSESASRPRIAVQQGDGNSSSSTG